MFRLAAHKFSEELELYGALQESSAAPTVPTEDRLTALSEEMLKMTKEIEDLQAENSPIKNQEPTPRAASEETTTMFRDFRAQETVINSANKAATEELSKAISNFYDAAHRESKCPTSRKSETSASNTEPSCWGL